MYLPTVVRLERTRQRDACTSREIAPQGPLKQAGLRFYAIRCEGFRECRDAVTKAEPMPTMLRRRSSAWAIEWPLSSCWKLLIVERGDVGDTDSDMSETTVEAVAVGGAELWTATSGDARTAVVLCHGGPGL